MLKQPDCHGFPAFARRTVLRASLLVLACPGPPAWAAGSVDAARLVFPVCMSCHTDPVTAARFVPYRFDAAGLTAAFRRVFQMNGYVALGAQSINDLATYFALPDSNDADRLMDWAEDTFPQLLSPRRQPTGLLLGYTYRFYPDTGIYVGSKDGAAWFYDSRTPGAAIQNLGTLRSFLDQMPNGR